MIPFHKSLLTGRHTFPAAVPAVRALAAAAPLPVPSVSPNHRGGQQNHDPHRNCNDHIRAVHHAPPKSRWPGRRPARKTPRSRRPHTAKARRLPPICPQAPGGSRRWMPRRGYTKGKTPASSRRQRSSARPGSRRRTAAPWSRPRSPSP